MGLDLGQISSQIEGMAADLSSLSRRRNEKVAGAVAILHEQGQRFDHLKAKVEDSKGRTTWLVAGLDSGLSDAHRPPGLPGDYVAVGVDGSQISVDRHSPIQCCLINVGACLVQYGRSSQALLESKPILCYRDEDLYIDDPASNDSRPLEGPVFSAKREIVAIQHLVDLLQNNASEAPLVALLDASLILWSLAGRNIPDFVRTQLLDEEFLKYMDKLQEMSAERGLAVASYVSAPRSTDVTNVLRVGVCPHEHVNCNIHCPPTKGKQCSQLDGVQDRSLFAVLLAEGERSSLFSSQSSIVQGYYREHEVYFFYLNVGAEIARVEIPRWVAKDERLLDLTHCLILEQTRLGKGYPVALTEAHESAVVTAADRESFWLLVEAEMERTGLTWQASEKSQSKIIRGI